jgi:hypothetical protein
MSSTTRRLAPESGVDEKEPHRYGHDDDREMPAKVKLKGDNASLAFQT